MTRRQRLFSAGPVVRALTLAVTASLPMLAVAQASPQAPVDDPNAPTTLGAERLTGRPDREIILERDAEVSRGGTTLNADRADYDVVEDRVRASGNIRLKRFNDRFTGDDLNLKLDTGEGYIENPTYHLELRNAQGRADRIDFEAQDRAVVQNGTYSTCEGPDPDWYLSSGTISLDSGRDIGTAQKAVLYFKGVPLLASPYMTFPLSEARKTGFLPPSIGTSNKGGLEVSTPYYINIAPNRDLTLYPRAISRRGLQLGAHARYLGETYSGQTRVEGIMNDRPTGDSRGALSLLHSQTLAPSLSFNANVNVASDDEYPNDFPHSITNSRQRLLPRDLSLTYARPYWSLSARASGYQVLQDPIVPIGRPYDRLPQISLNAARQEVGGFDLGMGSDFTRFYHPDLVRGDRSVINPRLSYPILAPGYFITPRLSLHASSYNLTNLPPGQQSTLTRTLPTFSLDTGLVFEREASFLGREATQTLEPRLFYVYTPYKDQSKFPLFDTALAEFSFAQIFSENRYVGNDRISDANQLTAAVVSRFIEENGFERVRFALGQRFYFNQQQVANVNGTSAENKSDLLAAVSGQVTQALALDAGVQYSQSLKQTNASSFGVRWTPAPQKVLNLQYRRDVPTGVDLVDFSTQWPIAKRLYGVGRVNYSLLEKKVSESLVGLEWKDDCWIFRVVAQRTPTATSVATSSLFFQLELNGLSSLGSNPSNALRNNVPGYTSLSEARP
jgi:LPS-assembly protein